MKKSNNIIEFKESKKNINIYNKIFKSLYKNKATIDYSKIIVRKPWGYEYVIYQNNKIAITILYINKNHMTSLHAHPRKKTSLIVLEGKIKCENLDNFNIVKTGECVLIDKKVFHKSKNISNKTSILMEVETPNKKYDILRYKDNYGRSKKGYETSENYSLNTNNYNYVSLLGSKTYHNITKKFGRSSITFLEINSINNFKNTILKNLNSIFIVLEGKIKINDIIFSDGDPFQGINIDFSKDKIILSKKVLILNVKKDDGYIKASDIIVRVLQNQNIKNVFLVAGDSNLHLLDSIGRNEEFNYNVFSNEYHASLASVGYSKYKQKPAVLILSSGHSTLKTIEAIYSAYIDSEPLIVISGQAIRGQNTSKELRQLGNKSVDIIALVKNITKYSVVINNETDLVYHLEKSIYISQEGRPGPVWIDIPIDVMGKILDEDKIKHFSSSEYLNKLKYENINNDISRVYKYLNLSKKPVLLIGYGVRLSRYENQILKLIKKLKIPVLTSRRGSDLIESSDKLYFGRPGVYGNRYSNFILQKTDLLISIGSRLSIPLIGRNFRNFAKNAKKIIVDVDAKELNKKTVKADLKLNYSSDIFIDGMNRKKIKVKSFNKWIDTCNIIKKQINIKLEKYEHNTNINPYLFIKDLSKIIPAS